MDNNFIIGAIIGSTLTIITTLVIKRAIKDWKGKVELKLLKEEIDDIQRHCEANLEILNNVKIKKGIPSTMHFEKMLLLDSSIVFSAETFRAVHHKYSSEIYNIKLTLRNLNMELQTMIDYIDNPEYDKFVMSKYVKYHEQKLNYAIKKLQYVLIKNQNTKRIENIRPKKIIYTKKYE